MSSLEFEKPVAGQLRFYCPIFDDHLVLYDQSRQADGEDLARR